VVDKISGDQPQITLYDSLPKKVAILYSEVKREYFPTEAQYVTEKDAERDAGVIAGYLNRMGVETVLIPGDDNLSENLKNAKPEMVFELVDSVKGYEFLSAAIPGILEILDIPFTGTDILGLSLCYNKFLIKKLLQQVGVPVPHYQLFNTATDLIDPTLRFPLISKLNEIHGAVEITKDAVSENEKHLRDRLKYLISTYKQPVLVEEFIVGREITGLVLEGLNTKVYMAEKVFASPETKYHFVTYESQWLGDEENKFKYAKYTDDNLKELIKKAFEVTKMSDYGKFDVRLDSSGRYYFIDINPNNAFGPKELETAMGCVLEEIYGVSFNEILRRLMINTLKGTATDFKTDFKSDFTGAGQ
jgi:D-alanine-D-alanine ligase